MTDEGQLQRQAAQDKAGRLYLQAGSNMLGGNTRSQVQGCSMLSQEQLLHIEPWKLRCLGRCTPKRVKCCHRPAERQAHNMPAARPAGLHLPP